MASKRTVQLLLVLTIVISIWVSRLHGQLWALAPIGVLCSLAWYIHLPPARRVLKGFVRFALLVTAQVAWAVLVGWLADLALEWAFGFKLVLPFAFTMPFAVPVLSTFAPGRGAVLFHVLLDLPFMIVIAANQFLYGEKLNSLATQLSDHIYLGSLPFASDVAQLKLLGVTHVINMCREWRGPVTQYDASGITQLRLPTTDGFAPSEEHLTRGAEFVQRAVSDNPDAKIFIHCRFGMGRSAAMAVVAMAALGWDIKAAAHHMKERRPEVTTTVLRHRSVQTVAALLKQRQENR